MSDSHGIRVQLTVDDTPGIVSTIPPGVKQFSLAQRVENVHLSVDINAANERAVAVNITASRRPEPPKMRVESHLLLENASPLDHEKVLQEVREIEAAYPETIHEQAVSHLNRAFVAQQLILLGSTGSAHCQKQGRFVADDASSSRPKHSGQRQRRGTDGLETSQ